MYQFGNASGSLGLSCPPQGQSLLSTSAQNSPSPEVPPALTFPFISLGLILQHHSHCPNRKQSSIPYLRRSNEALKSCLLLLSQEGPWKELIPVCQLSGRGFETQEHSWMNTWLAIIRGKKNHKTNSPTHY